MFLSRKKFNLLFAGMISIVLLVGFDFDAIREKLEEGDKLLHGEKYSEAEKVFSDVLQEVNKDGLNPQEELSKDIVIPRIYFSLGEIQNKQNKYENAKSFYEKVTGLQYRSYWDVKAIYNISLIDFNLKKYNAARGNFSRVISEHSGSEEAPQAQYYIALSYELESNKEEAKAAFNKFLKNFPRHPWVEKVKAKLSQK